MYEYIQLIEEYTNNTWGAIDKNKKHNRSMHYKCQMSSQIACQQ